MLDHVFAITKNELGRAHAVPQCLPPTALQAPNFLAIESHHRFIILRTMTTVMATIPFNCFSGDINALSLVTYAVGNSRRGWFMRP